MQRLGTRGTTRPSVLKALDVVGLSWLTRIYWAVWRSGAGPVGWQTGEAEGVLHLQRVHTVSGLSFRDKVRSSVTGEGRDQRRAAAPHREEIWSQKE